MELVKQVVKPQLTPFWGVFGTIMLGVGFIVVLVRFAFYLDANPLPVKTVIQPDFFKLEQCLDDHHLEWDGVKWGCVPGTFTLTGSMNASASRYATAMSASATGTGTNIGFHASAYGGQVNHAALFDGDVVIKGNLILNGKECK